MSLSGKVEDPFDKLNMNPPASTTPSIKSEESTRSKLSINLEDLRDYVIVLIGFGITIAAVFLLILPQYEFIGANSSKFATIAAERDELKRQGDYLESLVGLKDELEANIKVADQALPSAEDRVPYILDQILQIAADTSVEVDALSLGGISESGGGVSPEGDDSQIAVVVPDLRNVMIQISIVGGRENIQNFMAEISKARTLIDIDSYQVANTTAKAAIGEVVDPLAQSDLKQANISLVSYLKADDTTKTVDLTSLANSPNYDDLIAKLFSMAYYEPGPINTNFGRENPFDIVESTPSVSPVTEPGTTITPNPDSEGIQ